MRLVIGTEGNTEFKLDRYPLAGWMLEQSDPETPDCPYLPHKTKAKPSNPILSFITECYPKPHTLFHSPTAQD